MTTPPTLPEFLLARLADTIADCREIQALAVSRGIQPDDPREPGLRLARTMLADVAAKRRIVERESTLLYEAWRRRSDEHRQTFDEWFRKPYGETLRDLASVYADHPDFREEWAL